MLTYLSPQTEAVTGLGKKAVKTTLEGISMLKKTRKAHRMAMNTF